MLFFIQQTMEESIFPWVAASTRSKHAWDTLQNSYQGTRKVKLVRLQMLRRDFEKLQMSNSEIINDFFHSCTKYSKSDKVSWRYFG